MTNQTNTEQFCSRCFAGLDSSEHHEKCVTVEAGERVARAVTDTADHHGMSLGAGDVQALTDAIIESLAPASRPPASRPPASRPAADTDRDERLRDIAAREQAATDGPWSAHTTGRAGGDHWYICAADEAIAHISAQDGINEEQREPDAVFIAHARDDIPWLLTEIAAAHELLNCHRCDESAERAFRRALTADAEVARLARHVDYLAKSIDGYLSDLDERNEVIEHLREQVRVGRSWARDHAIAHHGAPAWTDQERVDDLVPVNPHRHGVLCRNPEADELRALLAERDATIQAVREGVAVLCAEWEREREPQYAVAASDLRDLVPDSEPRQALAGAVVELRRQVQAVRDLHRPVVIGGHCVGCWEGGGEDGAVTWPCPTIRALAFDAGQTDGDDSELSGTWTVVVTVERVDQAALSRLIRDMNGDGS